MADIGTLWFNMEFTGNWQQDLDKMAAQFKKLQKEIEEGQKKVNERASMTNAYKTLLREQQKIEQQVRRTASLQKGEYVKSIDMGTMATKTQLEAWQRLGDEMKRLEQLAASKGKKIVVNDSELTKARNLTNELSQQQRIENEIAAATRKTTEAKRQGLVVSQKQSRILRDLHSMALSYASVFGATRLLKSLYKITGEFEMQKVAMGAILNDVEAADKLFKQLQDLAVKSPFQFMDLAAYSKQLSAFSIPTKELYDTTKMLADVSAGLGVSMERLILAYGQIRAAAVLRGQEIRQLTEAGIPVLFELQKQFEKLGYAGITVADIFDKISARLVPFEMIKEMFEGMTREGGKFYQMQEIQAQTLKGKISNLKDAYQIAMYEIGESNSGVLKGSIDLIRKLIDSYDKVGNVLGVLIKTYGVYRGAVIALRVSDLVMQYGSLANVIRQSATAQQFLNKTMLNNPYVLAIAGIAAIISILRALNKETREFNNNLNDIMSREKASSQKLVDGLLDIKEKLEEGTRGTQKYKDAVDELNRVYGEYLPSLATEANALDLVRGRQDEITNAIYRTARARAEEKAVADAYERFSNEKETANLIKDIKQYIPRKQGGEIVSEREVEKQVQDLVRLYAAEIKKQTGKFSAKALFNKVFKEYYQTGKRFFPGEGRGDWFWDWLMKGTTANHALMQFTNNVTGLMNALNQISVAGDIMAGGIGASNVEIRKMLESVDLWEANELALLEDSLKAGKITVEEYSAEVEKLANVKLDKLRDGYLELGMAEKAAEVGIKSLTERTALWKEMAEGIMRGDDALLAIMPLQSGDSEDRDTYFKRVEDEYSKAEETIKRYSNTIDENAQIEVAAAKRRIDAIKEYFTKYGYYSETVFGKKNGVENTDDDDEKTEKKIKNLKKEADFIKKLADAYSNLLGMVDEATAKDILQTLFPDSDVTTDFNSQLTAIINQLKEIGGEKALDAAEKIALIFSEDKIKAAIEMGKAFKNFSEIINEWEAENFDLFGTGTLFDISKIVSDFENAIVKLNDKQKNAIDELKNKRLDANSDEYRRSIEKINSLYDAEKNAIRAIHQERINKLANAFVSDSLEKSGYKDAIQNMSNLTVKQIRYLQDKIGELSEVEVLKLEQDTLDRLSKAKLILEDMSMEDLSDFLGSDIGQPIDETQKKVLELIVKLKESGISMGEFAAAVKMAFEGKSIDLKFEEIKKNAKQIDDIAKSVSSSFSSIAELIGLDSEFAGPIKDIVDATGDLVKNIYELAANSSVWDDVGEGAEAAGKAMNEVAENAKDAIDSTGDTAISTGNAYAAIIGAVLKIGVAVMNIANAVKRQRIEEKVIAVNTELRRLNNTLDLIDRREGLGDGWFTDDAFQDVKNYNHQINELIKSLRSLKGEFNKISKKGSLYAGGATVLDALSGWDMGDYEDAKKRGYKDAASESVAKLRNMVIGVSDLMFELQHHINAINFDDIDLDKLISYRKALDELNFADDEADYEAMRDSMIEQIDLIEAALSNFKDSIRKIVGEISEDMRTTFNETWKNIEKNGKAAFGEIADTIKSEVGGVLGEMASSQMWNAIMKPYFDKLGAGLGELILNDGSQADMIKLMDDFWAGATNGMLDYQNAWEDFVEASKRSGWNVFEDALELPEDSITQMREKISKLRSEYENMSEEERGGDYGGSALLQKIKELEKALAKVEDAAAAAEANINKLLEGTTDRRKQIEVLLSYARGVKDQKEREIALQKRQNLLAEEYADLYSQYVPEAQAYEDELAKMNEDIEWAKENGYGELAKWIKEAFDTKVLENWRTEFEKTLQGLDTKGTLAAYDKAIAEKQKELNEIPKTAENGKRIEELVAEIRELKKGRADYLAGVKDDWRQMYITDEEKYLDRVKEFQNAIGEAVSVHDYEAAKRLEQALNNFKLDNWKSNVGDVLDDIESIPEKLSYIDEQIAGLDPVKDAAKILHLEELRADLLDEMNQKYETEEEAHARKIKALEAELAYYRSINDEVHARAVEEEIAAEVSAENARILGKQFEKEFADLDNMASMTTIKMLEEWKDMIEQREDLSKEDKEKLIGMANDAIDTIVNNVEDKFQKVSTIISDISGLLTAIGADSGFIEVINGIGSAVGELGSVVTSLMYGNIFGTISGLIRLMTSIVTIFKQAESRRMEEMLSGIALEVENLERAASRAFGANATAMNLQLIRQYEHAIALARQQVLKMEDAKNPDREQIANIKAQIKGWEDAILSLRETMSQDFFQDDFKSLSDTLIGVVAQYKDNLTEMTRQLNLTVDEMIKNLIHNYMSVKFLQDPLNRMMEDIFSTYTGSGTFDIPIDKLNNLRNWIATTVPELAEVMNDLYESLNISDMNFEGTANAIKSITESQANSLIGYMQNVMQGVHRGNNISESMLEYMRTSAANNANYLLSFAILAQNVQRIANNTDALAPIRSDIRDIRDNLRINRASL